MKRSADEGDLTDFLLPHSEVGLADADDDSDIDDAGEEEYEDDEDEEMLDLEEVAVSQP